MSNSCITFVQVADPSRKCLQRRIIHDDIVGDCESLTAARLCGQDAFRLFFRTGVACEQPLELRGLVTINNQNSINFLPQDRIDQKWHNYDDIVPGRSICLAQGLSLNSWVQNGLKSLPRLVIRKNQRSQGSSVEIAIRRNDRSTKFELYFCQAGFAGFDHFAGDNVGIDDIDAVFRE